ncbi:inactive poly [ADP-ribose] polymerase RCD1-like isoform X1 [Tanacetum coccineum]|uniref:Inactive poly [ADP-ribose] polymerase RCD1-like isoform X1 n=1 Tax=Tanacetum coccineum TaxID=301880 RepID=A0ABQ4WY79_9ASTR
MPIGRRLRIVGLDVLFPKTTYLVVRSDLDQGRSYGRLQRYGNFATSPNIFFSGANIILATSGNDDMALKGKNYPQVEDMNVSPLEKAKKMNRDEFIRKLRSVVGD